MAHQVYAAYTQQQNRGTLSPGQTIVINKYTVQVDRYLSQGGFAHVYVVRTANPINNSTQHVLKRIAVADENMLNVVRKEVDIMRMLRGHPNIVNFIDASWNQLPNRTFEVLILMELCPGGGIIDMMNRRLRERLTEAEILQIFVDVCEAVAVMHNLKPPLLHRDLKVENILQSSATRYKLCDFGSSAPVAARPPSSLHEIRALEADLSKHTTLQYRAPEMVDVHLRRPVDEKSDVWALGVLLYKLCYYTTPFEEHGPLAILNVQYRIPPYPVYSTQMNSLIASMLRELGAQRPSVFEILDLVHRMRGSKSPYRYNVVKQQPLRLPPQQSTLDDIITFRSPPAPNSNLDAAAQARQTVLNAIAPMRRGRPTTPQTSNSPPSDPQQRKELDARKFEERWNAVKAGVSDGADDGWEAIGKKTKDKKAGFGDDFDGFGDPFTEPKLDQATSIPASSPSPVMVSSFRLDVKKDAFDDLGISRSRGPSPTLAEAKSRLAGNGSPRPLPPLNPVSRTPVLLSVAAPISPRIPASRTGLATYRSPTSLSVEERFPSMDDLDKGWRAPFTSQTPPVHAVSQQELPNKSITPQQPARPTQPPLGNAQGGFQLPEHKNLNAPPRGEARSQQVTGTAMRSGQVEIAATTQPTSFRPTNPLDPADKRHAPIGSSPTKYRPSRPALARKHRSSISIKPIERRSPPPDWLTGDEPVAGTNPMDVPPSPVKRVTPILFSAHPQASGPGAQGSLGNPMENAGARHKQDIKPTQEAPPPVDLFQPQESIPLKTPIMEKQLPTKNVRRRQDSSSDDVEGPEDVDGRVVAEDIRKRRTKGRQSSVHDLVDLYGGGRASVEREWARAPSPVAGRKGRRTSGILVDLSLPPSTMPQPELLSPASIVPESRAELAGRRSESQGERISPPANLVDLRDKDTNSGSRTSPVALAADRMEKPRPQSMFMFPAPKPLDSVPNTGPSNGARRRSSPRRGSISEMVDLYENLGGHSRLKDPPAIASKPAGLKLNKTPSPIASRFPVASPSLPISETTSVLSDSPKLKPKSRRSPTASSFSSSASLGLPLMQDSRNDLMLHASRRKSVSPAKPTPAPAKLSPVSATSSPFKHDKPSLLPIPASNAPFSPAGQRTPETETPISSPSPERPYQGVGRLIDQWQKKTEEANALRHPASRTTGKPSGPRVLGRPK